MKIIHVRTEKNDVKLAHPFSYFLATLEHLPYMLITLETDAGVTGHGEAAIGWDTTGEVQEGSREMFDKFMKPIIIGKELEEVADVEELMAEADKYIYGNTALKSGIEFALLDALGKYKNQAVHELLDGKNLEYVIPQKVFSFESQGLEAVRKRMAEASENGVRFFKFKAGPDVGPLVDLFEKLSQTDPDYRFVLDVNQGWSDYSGAMERIRQLEKFNIAWIEQPIYHEDFDGLSRIRKETDIPIMVDESCHTLLDLENLHRREALDHVNIKLAKCGGMLKARKLMRFCDENGIRYMLGSMINSRLGVASDLQAATLGDLLSQDLTFPERLAEDRFTGIRYEGYRAYIPQAPGLGVELSS